jgi:lipoprotein-anchoring transpeptidase ErfK/SrfK
MSLSRHRNPPLISRREILKVAAAGLTGLALSPFERFLALTDFPQAERLGRACATVEIKSQPDPESATSGILYEDYVVPWLRELSGLNPTYVFNNQRWVEIPDGYVYAPYLQPVQNVVNPPLSELPATSLGAGMWAEVTVPYVDIRLDGDPTENSWVGSRTEQGQPLRVYYSQVFWIDRIQIGSSGLVEYHINPNYYGGLDQFWVDARAMRPILPDDLKAIHPEAENKRITVDVTRQALSCFEDDQEVYYCRTATGAIYDMYGNIVDHWSTPIGVHQVTRKFISLQMSGGTTGAPYDLPGIGWTVIFATGGVAIHSTFWHNNFGDPMSHGCVNISPKDAKWIFLWTLPTVTYDPGMVDVTVTGELSTVVEVTQS